MDIFYAFRRTLVLPDNVHVYKSVNWIAWTDSVLLFDCLLQKEGLSVACLSESSFLSSTPLNHLLPTPTPPPPLPPPHTIPYLGKNFRSLWDHEGPSFGRQKYTGVLNMEEHKDICSKHNLDRSQCRFAQITWMIVEQVALDIFRSIPVIPRGHAHLALTVRDKGKSAAPSKERLSTVAHQLMPNHDNYRKCLDWHIVARDISKNSKDNFQYTRITFPIKYNQKLTLHRMIEVFSPTFKVGAQFTKKYFLE